MGFELPFVIGPEYIAVALFGVVIGIIFGAIPGMTATMAVAVFLPLTYAYSMEMALYLLLGLYVGGISGGLVPAILINIPGTPSSVCTTFDGHPMALRGEGERARLIRRERQPGRFSFTRSFPSNPFAGRVYWQLLSSTQLSTCSSSRVTVPSSRTKQGMPREPLALGPSKTGLLSRRAK